MPAKTESGGRVCEEDASSGAARTSKDETPQYKLNESVKTHVMGEIRQQIALVLKREPSPTMMRMTQKLGNIVFGPNLVT